MKVIFILISHKLRIKNNFYFLFLDLRSSQAEVASLLTENFVILKLQYSLRRNKLGDKYFLRQLTSVDGKQTDVKFL